MDNKPADPRVERLKDELVRATDPDEIKLIRQKLETLREQEK